MPMIINNKSTVDVCSISKGGIGMTNGVVKKTGWEPDDMIQVGFIENAACMVFRKSKEGTFKLAYANKQKKTGGKIYCISFIQNYLQTLFEIPKKGVQPIHLSNTAWDMALIMDEPEWVNTGFTKMDVNKIPKNDVGIYELLGRGDAVLRIGEGKLYERLNAHLKDKRFAPPAVKGVRYVALNETVDGQLFEKIRITQFENMAGVLPRFQEIRA